MNIKFATEYDFSDQLRNNFSSKMMQHMRKVALVDRLLLVAFRAACEKSDISVRRSAKKDWLALSHQQKSWNQQNLDQHHFYVRSAPLFERLAKVTTVIKNIHIFCPWKKRIHHLFIKFRFNTWNKFVRTIMKTMLCMSDTRKLKEAQKTWI